MAQRDVERQIFLDLLDGHGATMMSTLRRLCGNAHDAEDVFQETAVRVWRGLQKRPRLSSPRAWLLTIAYRSFLDYRRPRATALPHEDFPDASERNPADQATLAEECDRLEVAVSNLPEPIRAVLTLHYTGGLSLRQTARAMNLSVGTVKSRLNSGLERLRKVL